MASIAHLVPVIDVIGANVLRLVDLEAAERQRVLTRVTADVYRVADLVAIERRVFRAFHNNGVAAKWPD